MGDIITQQSKYEIGWTGGLPETPCGYGSTMKATELQREWIPDMMEKYSIRSVVDIGAGDLNWVMQSEIPTLAKYTALDLVPRHSRVQAFDIRDQIPPPADAYFCLWVLNHMDKADAEKSFKNILAGSARYLFLTDRPIWREDHPMILRDLAYLDRIVLNEKADCILLMEL